MEIFQDYFYQFFKSQGINESTAEHLNLIVLLLILAIVLVFATWLIRKIIIKAFQSLARNTETKFDDMLIKNRVPLNVARMVPLVIAVKLLPFVFNDFPAYEGPIELLLKIIGIILFIWILRSILRTFEDYFNTKPRLMDKPIDSYIQVVMLFVWVIGFASIFVIITDISFWKFFTTLGAASAILLLIFKDTLLGFVASIQVAVNDTVRIGDWITMEKYGADGDVIEINLNTVQVQNFDKTITNIPTYALLSDAFTNWRGMSNSGGRRIKRAVIIKASSIKYLADNEVKDLKKIELITDYLETRQSDIKDQNQKNNVDKSLLINGRNLTNFGVFRKYLQTYIENHSAVNKE
ncbi:MAG: mechanosensitive ion channel, partial [Flavobacteriaceae bacterium]|nr:mechanosensitive ion channel [Flavobacteriaceae bacterium]